MAQINKSSEYFNTVLYTGTGAEQSISSLDFSPDFTWIKVRSNGTYTHALYDAVRGVNKPLSSSSTNAEGNDTEGGLTSFNSDGFTVGGFYYKLNQSGQTYASWSWRGSDSSAVTNNDGSITSTVSANTTSGFSICKFTNPSSAINFTFGHGLGVAPRMFIMKGLNTSNWQVYHESVGNTYNTQLNYDNASTSAANWWGSTSPTSTVCTVGASLVETSQDSIAYCFAEKKGFSKFGSYTGNGNADGTFVYLGFEPAFVIIKKTNSTGDWTMYDNKRIGYNGGVYRLKPNTSESENTSNVMDLLSNGFKLKVSDGDKNGSGDTFIYMAFAENPLVGTNNIPATAR